MSPLPLNPDDPRLTAYVLGELTDDERSDIERWLADSAVGRDEVARLRELTAVLFAALQPVDCTRREPSAQLESLMRSALQGSDRETDESTVSMTRSVAPERRNRIGVAATLLTAFLLLTVALSLGPWNGRFASDASGMSLSWYRDPALRAGSPFPGRGTESTSDFLLGAIPESIALGRINQESKSPTDYFDVSSGRTLERLTELQLQQGVPLPQLGRGASPMSRESRDGTRPSAGASSQESLADSYSVPVVGTPIGIPGKPHVPARGKSPAELRFGSNGRAETWMWEKDDVLDDQVHLLPLTIRGQELSRFAIPNRNKSSVGGSDGTAAESIDVFEIDPLSSTELAASSDRADSLRRGYYSGHRFRFVEDGDSSATVTPGVVSAKLRQLARGAETLSREGRESIRDLAEIETREDYSVFVENAFVPVLESPLSTFGLDVDTASYSNLRRFLFEHRLPPQEAVRIEELVNSFDYDIAPPEGKHPLAVTVEAGRCPWQPDHLLARIAVCARAIAEEKRPPTSLVFLIDVSGSMSDADKLPLVQASLRLLVERMEEQDRIAIVTYADEARTVLDSTTADHKDRILEAIDSLHAEGSTNGAGGLELAYQVASRHLIDNGANRILLCTDGDFNVGVSDNDGVFELIEDHRKSGVFLTVLGFGTGNLQDSKLEGLANRGNGHYVYIDRLEQARRTLVEQLTGTLFAVAKDVKLQVEFNPARVEAYRLIGYENRRLNDRDFADNRIDAGEIGAGHQVTALYEVVPVGGKVGASTTPLRYQAPAADPSAGRERPHGTELLFVKLRYKQADADESVLIETPLLADDAADLSQEGRWAAAVATFGLLLRDSKFKGRGNWDSLLGEIRKSLTFRNDQSRIEFLDMAIRARSLQDRVQGKVSQTPKLTELHADEARIKASCDGRYSELLDKFPVPEDGAIYGDFHEHGYRRGQSYLPKAGRPDGYWVYVYPDWYIWRKQVASEKK